MMNLLIDSQGPILFCDQWRIEVINQMNVYELNCFFKITKPT